MRPEQAFYQLLRPHLPGLPERIENAAGAGTPDFHCIYSGLVYWVECKTPRTKKWELLKLLEPSQIAWYKRYALSGGTVFFVVKDISGIHLFSSLTNKIGFYPKPYDWSAFSLEINLQLLDVPT